MKMLQRWLFVICFVVFGAANARAQQNAPENTPTFAADAPLEVAFCLDISGSMISQRKVATESILKKLHGWMAKRPVRAALIAYYDGNRYSATDLGTGDTVVSEALKLAVFDVAGRENVGQYIALAVQRLSWTRDQNALKNTERRIVVVGNEAMRDDYAGAALRAREAGWIVDAMEGYSRSNWSVILPSGLNHWQDLARIGGGTYEKFRAFASVPRPGLPAPDQTPFDAELRALNVQYNQTFRPYGAIGMNKALELEAEEKQFDETGALFVWLMRKVNTSFADWDFIDAWQFGTVKIDGLPDTLTPPAYRGLAADKLVPELSKTLQLRRRIGGVMRALGLQRQSFLIAQQNTQIDAQRRQFYQQQAAQTPTNPTGGNGNPNNPVPVDIPAGNGGLPFGLGTLVPSGVTLGGLNAGIGFGQGAPLDLTKPADTIGAPAGGGIPILGEIPDLTVPKPAAKPAQDEGPNDEFAKLSTLSNWQKPTGQKADAVEIDALDGQLVLRDGEIWKARSDDFAATIRVRVSDSKTAPDFAFLLRDASANKDDFGWKWSAANQKWQAVTPEAAGEIEDKVEVDAAGFTTLRVARVHNTLLMLARVDKNWKLLRRLPIKSTNANEKTDSERKIVLQASAQKNAEQTDKTDLFGALEAQSVALPHVDWIRFRKINPEDLPIGKTEITDVQWLEALGKILD